MPIIKEFNALIRPPKVNFDLLDTLYSISEKSLLLVILLDLLTTYILFPFYGIAIVTWNLLLLLLIAYRFYCYAQFKKNYARYTPKVWYKKLVIGALMVASFFGVLGFLIIAFDPVVEHHLFIIILLFGLSSGASSSFAVDYRLSIQYSTVILGSLITGMVIHGTLLYWLMGTILLIYLGSRIFLLVQNLRQEQKISQQKSKITQVQGALQEKQNQIHHFMHESPIAIFTYNTDLEITDVNHAHLALFQSTKEESVGEILTSLPHSHIIKVLKDALYIGPQTYIGSHKTSKGLELWVEFTAFSFNDEYGQLTGGIGIINDRTKEHAARNTLNFHAEHDQLTSLLNRRGLQIYLESFVQQKEHTASYSLLFYLDLDKFKHINDSLGHKTGDELLISISSKLRRLSKNNCILSRFGGDEFIVLCPYVTDNLQTLDEKAEAYTERIQEIFAKPFVIDGMRLLIQTSIGIVIIKPKETDMKEIIRHADIAMYEAKKTPHTHIAYYNTALDHERKELFLLQHHLSSAIQDHQLRLYLQPLVSITDDTLVAAECLLRWEHPSFGLILPDRFIPTAIETGTISTITWWIIEEVCSHISQLKNTQKWHLQYISVNVDAKQLLLNHFVDTLLSILDKYGIRSNELMLEITEQSLIDNFEGTQKVIATLKEEGIHCAIDDFGTGYSSLSYLKKLSFKTLKIDKAFIKDIQNRPDDINLVKSILEIGHAFHYSIVVEGIETLAQKRVLQDMDPDLTYQGYLFQKPIPFERFVDHYLRRD